jgi:dTDP-4-dehydrorhamnose 3,5-epimerase-like enzyme
VPRAALVVHLYALVWNERPLLPFFLEHYRPFVDRFFLFDDGSDDGSAEYLAEQPDVTLSRFDGAGASFVDAARSFYNEAWKASRGRADFVGLVNIDELLHHPDPRAALQTAREKGYTFLTARGWDIVSDAFPTEGPLVRTTNRGVHSRAMAKTAFFDPDAIEDAGFSVGRHAAAPSGRVVRPTRPWFDLLHYKHLGEDYLIARYRALAARMRSGDREAGYGRRYEEEETRLRDQFARLRAAARPVLVEDLEAEGLLSRPLPGVEVRVLADGRNARGGLQEIWRDDDPFGVSTAQAYVTTTLPGVVKAWYRHKRQTDQICVLSGAVRLVLWSPREEPGRQGPVELRLDGEVPRLVVIPPFVWHGFKAVGPDSAIILHLNDKTYDWPSTDEDRLPPDHPAVPWRWRADAPASGEP